MSYKRAEEILPVELIEIIQQYVDGENLYIPRKSENRKEWGSSTCLRQELIGRNEQIYREHHAGAAVSQLAVRYYLSEKSIQRIIRQIKSEK